MAMHSDDELIVSPGIQKYIDTNAEYLKRRDRYIEEVVKNRSSLNINLYVNKYDDATKGRFEDIYRQWADSSDGLKTSMESLFNELGN